MVADLALMAELEERMTKKRARIRNEQAQLKALQREYTSLDARVRRNMLSLHADGNLPDNVSVRGHRKYRYDPAKVLEVALAEGVEQVINRKEPTLYRSIFTDMLDEGVIDPEAFGVEVEEGHTVYIGKAALLRARNRVLEEEAENDENPGEA